MVYRGIPVVVHGDMVEGGFATTAVEVEAVPCASWADQRWRAKQNLAALLEHKPTHASTLLGDLEWEATQWYAKQPVLAFRVVSGKTTHYYDWYCVECGVPKGTKYVERVIDMADLNVDGSSRTCETCGHMLEDRL